MARKKENKRSDGYYEVKCVIGHTFDGKSIYKSFYSRKSKADAREKAEKYKKSMSDSKSMKLFKEVAAELAEIKKDQVRDNTYEITYCYQLNELVSFFGESYMESITKDDINRFFKSKKDYKKSTLMGFVGLLKAVFFYAKDNEYIENNVMDRYKLEYGKKSKEKSVFTPVQAELCLEYCKIHKYGLAVNLMLSYGLSRSETLGIEIKAVDYENKTIAITQSVVNTGVRETKNKYRKRIVAVNDDTLELIRKSETKSGFLFSDKAGNPITPFTMSKRVKKFMEDMQKYYADKEIEMPILHPHELRHSRATIWVNEGRNLFAIAQQMGWSDLDMLRKRYAHADINELRKELDL